MSLLIFLNNTKETQSSEFNIPTKGKVYYRTSPLVREQLPDFIDSNHPRFVAFVNAYFEWLEQENNLGAVGYFLSDLKDIDTTNIERFFQHFKYQFLNGFPEDLVIDAETQTPVDRQRLVKRIKEFYRAKGSEKSYEFLFRILFDSYVEFYYPREDILSISDGKWYLPRSIKVSLSTDYNIHDIRGNTITQFGSNGAIARAKVEDVIVNTRGSIHHAELFLSNINGTFVPDKIITLNFLDGDKESYVYPVISSIDSVTGGSSYQIGDPITISGVSGEGAKAVVDVISIKGAIEGISLVESGINYFNTDNPTFSVNTFRGSGATFKLTVGAVTLYPGIYINDDGKLNSVKKIRDNYFFQEFSYQLRSSLALERYKQYVLDVIHPAGLKLFGALVQGKSQGVTFGRSTSAEAKEISILGHYTPYTFNTKENLRDTTKGVDLYPFGYNGVTSDLVAENGTTPHDSTGARPAIYYGKVYYEESSRTGPSIVGDPIYAFDVTGSGETWEPGTTGPMWYLSQGVTAEGASAAYVISLTADAGDFANNGSYWVIFPHPNSRNIDTIPPGTTFSNVVLDDFFYIPVQPDGGVTTDYDLSTPSLQTLVFGSY